MAERNEKLILDLFDGGQKQQQTEAETRFAEAQTIGGCEIPGGFEVWLDGVYVVTDYQGIRPMSINHEVPPPMERRAMLERITRKPVWIKQFGYAEDTKEQLIELSFIDVLENNVTTLWVDRSQIATKAKLVALAREGLPVHDVNVGAFLTYLDASLHLNGPRLPCARVAIRSGPYKVETIVHDKGIQLPRPVTGWLLGTHWIGPQDRRIEFDVRRGTHEFADGLAVSGTREDWQEIWDKWCNKSVEVKWLLHTVMAAPLLPFVKQRTFGIHHWCASGGGKTALLKLSLTAWGDPVKLIQTFNGTDLSFTEHFNYINGIPLAFDELQSSKSKNQSSMMYDLTNERGRKRASQRGGLESAIGSWKAIIRTTGEEPIIGKGDAVDLGGQGTRCMQLRGALLTKDEGRAVYNDMKDEHYGHGARIFLENLYAITYSVNGAAKIDLKYQQMRDAIEPDLGDDVKDRAGYLAIIALATYLMDCCLHPEKSQDRLYDRALADAIYMGNHLAKDDNRETVTERALAAIRDDFNLNRRMWCDLINHQDDKLELERGATRPFGAIKGEDEIWIIPSYLKTILAKEKLPLARVTKDLRDEGMMPISDLQRLRSSRALGTFQGRVYVINTKAVFGT